MAAPAETLERYKLPVNELDKSFDPSAAVLMLRHDIETTGSVLPETMEQVCNEELSYIAEGIDLHSYTRFVLSQNETGDLVYFKDGEWKPYLGLLYAGLQVSKQEAQNDYRKEFLHKDAQRDIDIGLDMQKLKPGESFAYYSAFPEHEFAQHGAEFVTELGFNVKRKMGFIYRVEKLADGRVALESHTVDNSKSDAFEAAMFEADFNPDASIESMVAAYDDTLSNATGFAFHAGRQNIAGVKEENAWEFVNQHKPLFHYYFGELIKLAQDSSLVGANLEREKKELTIGVWARAKELLNAPSNDNPSFQSAVMSYSVPSHSIGIELQVQRAYQAATSRGETLTGCGGAMRANADSFEDATLDDAFKNIFGADSNELTGQTDKYGSLTFECPKGHKNKRPRNQLIECCQTCGTNVRC